MPHLAELIPDAETLVTLEPDELGLRMLPALAGWQDFNGMLNLKNFVDAASRDNVPGRPSIPAPYPADRRSEVAFAVREAWQWLLGNALLLPSLTQADAVVLSRRADRIAEAPDPVRAHAPRLLNKAALAPEIREDVWSLFQRGKFATAIFEAMKAVEVAVRSASGITDQLGVKLMRTAFHPDNGPLADESADAGERVARMELFAGAIGSFKNPHSHRQVEIETAEEAAEIIGLASHLLRIVEQRDKRWPANRLRALHRRR